MDTTSAAEGSIKAGTPLNPGLLTAYAAIVRQPGWLDPCDVLRLHSLTPLGRLVGYLGALVEGLEAVASYARVMHEEVLATLVRGDEAVALIIVEPLYRSLGHKLEPTFLYWGSTATKKPLLMLRAALLTHHKTHVLYCTHTLPRVGPGHPEGYPGPVQCLRSAGHRGQTKRIDLESRPYLASRRGPCVRLAELGVLERLLGAPRDPRQLLAGQPAPLSQAAHLLAVHDQQHHSFSSPFVTRLIGRNVLVAGGSLAGGSRMGYRGGAIGYPRSGGSGRTLPSPRRARLCSRRRPSRSCKHGAQALAGEAKQSGDRRMPVVYFGNGRRRLLLAEAMDNLKEAGQRIRATQSLMRSQGMTDGENCRDLLTRLSTALAMTEAVYLEAKRRREL